MLFAWTSCKEMPTALKAEFTIEGMHIYEAGYRAIWPAVKEEILR